ncbi:MAG: hypothetical protein LBD86_03500, partial [Spirochaetaceae bacterium]|nr:hypothetical protein [Spirochaetaceae bacterium]
MCFGKKHPFAAVLPSLFGFVCLCACADDPSAGRFYVNLREYTTYIRTGFDPALINTKPRDTDNAWYRINGETGNTGTSI